MNAGLFALAVRNCPKNEPEICVNCRKLRLMELEDIISKVNAIMIDEFEVEEEAISPEAELGKDLGLDSLDGVDLVVAVEKEFGCKIQEDVARNMRTLKDVYDYVGKYYAQQRGA